ncbi:MAG: hypothetical protein AB7O48_06270 [Cyclobacteriaceae bacterium]
MKVTMNRITQEIDQLLQDYLEGNLVGEKLEKVKKGLDTSEELRNRLEILKTIELSMQKGQLMEPSSHFTQRVMSNLHKLPATQGITPRNGLLLLAGILVALGIGVTLVDAGFYNSLNGILSFENVKLPTGVTTPSLPSIPFNGKWVVNGIIGLNIGLAFLLLDRTILKPFFQRRSRVQF